MLVDRIKEFFYFEIAGNYEWLRWVRSAVVVAEWIHYMAMENQTLLHFPVLFMNVVKVIHGVGADL